MLAPRNSMENYFGANPDDAEQAVADLARSHPTPLFMEYTFGEGMSEAEVSVVAEVCRRVFEAPTGIESLKKVREARDDRWDGDDIYFVDHDVSEADAEVANALIRIIARALGWERRQPPVRVSVVGFYDLPESITGPMVDDWAPDHD
jgi:hypothetical protein